MRENSKKEERGLLPPPHHFKMEKPPIEGEGKIKSQLQQKGRESLSLSTYTFQRPKVQTLEEERDGGREGGGGQNQLPISVFPSFLARLSI